MTSSEGWTVVITQSGSRGRELTDALNNEGVKAVHAPLIETASLPFDEIFAEQLSGDPPVAGYILTSAVAARIFVSLVRSHPDWNWGTLLCYCIGEGTALPCREFGIPSVVYPGVDDADAFSKKLLSNLPSHSTVVCVRGRQARSTVPTALRSSGHHVIDWIVYETRSIDWKREIPSFDVRDGKALWILFSPSGVQSLLENIPLFRTFMNQFHHRVMAFGKTTKQALDDAHVDVSIVASSATQTGLIGTVKEYLKTLEGDTE